MSALEDLSSISDAESFSDVGNNYEVLRSKKHRRKHSKSKRSRERKKYEAINSNSEDIDDRRRDLQISDDHERSKSRHKRKRKEQSDFDDHRDSKRNKSKHKSHRKYDERSESSSESEVESKSTKHRHSSRRHRHKHKSSRGSKRDQRFQSDNSPDLPRRPERMEDGQSPNGLHPSLRGVEASKWDDVSTDSRRQPVHASNNNAQSQEDTQDNREGSGEEKAGPNMGLSGKLTEDVNTYKGVVIKYSQPSEARKPKRRWRWYIFKGEDELPFLPLHRQSAYLIGRERKVVDVPTDHPSCSKQHAVLQYRLVRYTKEDGTVGRTVKPYIIDLDSANGTFVNNRRIPSRSYVELLEKDVVKFGYSSREYVLLHEMSKDSDGEGEDGGLDMSPVTALINLERNK